MTSHIFRPAIFLLCFAFPVLAQAQFGYSTAYTYTTNNSVITTNGAVTISSYSGPGGSVTIPVTIGDYPVVSIGSFAFVNQAGITGVVIPDSVTSI
jgi:hypothetical protein